MAAVKAPRATHVMEPVPVVFGAVLSADGQKGPAEIPGKRIHLSARAVAGARRRRADDVPARASVQPDRRAAADRRQHAGGGRRDLRLDLARGHAADSEARSHRCSHARHRARSDGRRRGKAACARIPKRPSPPALRRADPADRRCAVLGQRCACLRACCTATIPRCSTTADATRRHPARRDLPPADALGSRHMARIEGVSAMRIGIVVDSACDVPPDFIEREQITILPVTVQIGDAVLADMRNEQATLELPHRRYRGPGLQRRHHAVHRAAGARPVPVEAGAGLRLRVLHHHHPLAQRHLRQRAAGQLHHPQRIQAGARRGRPQHAVLAARDRQPERVRRGRRAGGGSRAPARRRRGRAEDPRAAREPRAVHPGLHGAARPALPAQPHQEARRQERQFLQRRAGHRAGHQAGPALQPRRHRAGGQGQGLRERGGEAVRFRQRARSAPG